MMMIDFSQKTSSRSKPTSQSAWRLWGGFLLILGIILSVVLAVVVLPKRSEVPALTAVPPDPQAMEEEAVALQEKGEYAAAEELFRKCLSERQRIFGPEHIDSLAAMNNLANLLHDRGINAEAETLHRL